MTIDPDAGRSAPDLFAGDAAAFGALKQALYEENRFPPKLSARGRDFFARRNLTAIVLEFPNQIIDERRVLAWATASLHGYAPDVTLLLLTNTPISDGAMPLVELKRSDLPCFRAPNSATEQQGLASSRPTPHPA